MLDEDAVNRDHLIRAIVTFAAALMALLAVCAACLLDARGNVQPRADPGFTAAPKDRPLLEGVRRVEDARSTGVALFWFDGVLYVTRNLPEEYVDYSAWYTRLP